MHTSLFAMHSKVPLPQSPPQQNGKPKCSTLRSIMHGGKPEDYIRQQLKIIFIVFILWENTFSICKVKKIGLKFRLTA